MCFECHGIHVGDRGVWMRIIDKNTDFYDYLQNVYRDDSVTYDRTDSFILTKEMLCHHLQVIRRWNGQQYTDRFVLLQEI